MRARVLSTVLLAGLVMASCSGAESTVSVRSASAITTVPPDTTAATAPTTEPTTTGPLAPDASAPADGGAADGVGDALFRSLGNPGIDVVDYAVRLRYDPELDTIDGSVTLRIVATEQRESFTLDAVGLDIGEVRVDGVPAEFDVEAVELRITPAEPLTPGRSLAVVVDYRAAPDAGGRGSIIPNGWFHSDGGSFVLNEPDGARSWLPSNDHPSDKATWTFEIIVPSGMTAVANGELRSTYPTPDGDAWVWRQDDLMPTYLVQLLTGDYEIIEGTGPNGLPLVSAVLRADVADSQPYLDGIAAQIDFFDDLFGPYPLDRYGIAVTDSLSGLAMETMGRSTFSNRDLDGEVGLTSELLLSHELAHQWFGDAVTLGRWQDIWLNESFATYGQWLWFDHLGAATLADQAARGLAARSGPPTGSPGADDLFGINSYDGGAAVLHALRRTIGDDEFFTLLRRWVGDNTGTSPTTEDFIALAEEVSGSDLTDFFATWLYARDVPEAYPTPMV